MKWITVIYNTVWFRTHPVWGRTGARAIYPSWRAAFETARILYL